MQSATYFLGVCLFSISFLVFLNASVSFVIADVIGIERGIGDLVGTLGFVDELVALAACPAWGLMSDVVGARLVCVIGYTIVGLALFVFVQAENVYPQLLLARILFSLGGAATCVCFSCRHDRCVEPSGRRYVLSFEARLVLPNALSRPDLELGLRPGGSDQTPKEPSMHTPPDGLS